MTHRVLLLPLALTVFLGCSRETPPAASPSPAPATTATETSAAVDPVPAAKGSPRKIEIAVTDEGFRPTPITVKKGEPLELVVTRKTEKTCAHDMVIPSLGISKPLPMNQPVTILMTPDKAGELTYGCAMGQMISGVLMVE